ncbi:DUF1176 domain-containing protein [Aliihoeflea sp. PC F10.4]
MRALSRLLAPALILCGTTAGAQPAYIDDRSSPDTLVRSLYNAIERKEFARAWSYFAEPPADSVEDYASGFADTASVEVLVGGASEEGAAGSVYYQLPVVIRSVAENGDQTVYAGCYTLRQPNPANSPEEFTPLGIEEGALEETDATFGPDAVPTRCTPDGAELPEQNTALIEAERVFEATFADRCTGRDREGMGEDAEAQNYDIPFRYMHETGDDPMSTAHLFRFACNFGAYNVTHIYMMSTGDGSAEPVYFAVPELDIRYENDDMEAGLQEMTQIGWITRAELVNSEYDADTQAITTNEKWRGVGDASSSGRWIFRYGAFSLVEYSVDPTYDGEINPQEILNFNEAP